MNHCFLWSLLAQTQPSLVPITTLPPITALQNAYINLPQFPLGHFSRHQAMPKPSSQYHITTVKKVATKCIHVQDRTLWPFSRSDSYMHISEPSQQIEYHQLSTVITLQLKDKGLMEMKQNYPSDDR